ncbi:MAG: aminotransferase class V-fold PLP-dependent enzyme [Planctomycetes bacterium]|nr:aminotransferase class V-fold PLP-dependent enzyme [Planctomycetota bacterium]
MIYLDHAATSFPKPPEVAAAVQQWFAEVGVSAERGEGPTTQVAAATVRTVRAALASRTGTIPERVAFCSGATEGLNLALRAMLRPGTRVLTTPFEHSSVVRPLRALQDQLGLEVERQPTVEALCASIARRPPEVVVLTHASNVTGEVFDAAAVVARAREVGARVVLDASQTVGYLPIDVGADVVVASGHKALHGPPGLGFVCARRDVELAPQKYGGTGSSAALDRHPTDWPQAFEAGTPNTPAIFGLDAALRVLEQHGERVGLSRALDRLDQLLSGLRERADLRIIGGASTVRTPVVSLQHSSYDPLELCAILAGAGIHARAGYHCAPWVHEHLGTAAAGTLRLSPGPTTTSTEIDAVLEVLRSL